MPSAILYSSLARHDGHSNHQPASLAERKLTYRSWCVTSFASAPLANDAVHVNRLYASSARLVSAARFDSSRVAFEQAVVAELRGKPKVSV